jgi:glycosyltransferase involved in cell wall biosynthesis
MDQPLVSQPSTLLRSADASTSARELSPDACGAGIGAGAHGLSPEVSVLMASYNGATHIEQQLRSLADQTHAAWRLVVSDDGSTDTTRAIVERFAARYPPGRVTLVDGPAIGDRGRPAPPRDPREYATRNFLALLARHAERGEFFALSDQDDIWLPDKLARAVEWLSSVAEGTPALYCSRTTLIDDDGRVTGQSPLFAKPPSFRNALVQSLAGGNTMVLNRRARDIVSQAGVVPVVAHDWWIYLLLSGCGGRIKYDPVPGLHYRQHGANLVGSNQGLGALISRARLVWDGGWADWTDRHLEALAPVVASLSDENRALLARFAALRRGRLADRLRLLREIGLYRQTKFGQLSLAAAALMRRL